MTFEKMKTVALTVLVLLSMILTYQLWTYQPDYEPLDRLETVEKVTLASEQKLDQVIQPFQVLFHLEGEHFGSFNLNQFKDVYAFLLDGTFTNLRERTLDFTQLTHAIDKGKSVEFVYPDGFGMDIFYHVFKFNDREMDLAKVDRILLFDEEKTNDPTNTKAWFISYDTRRYIEADVTNLTFSTFEEWYHDNQEALLTLMSKTLANRQAPVYFPAQEVEVHKYQAAYPVPMSEIELTEALFPDPTVVRQSYTESGVRSYTDGSRELKLFTNAHYLTFINPTRSGDPPAPQQPVALQAFRFINNHGGFTEHFLLSRIRDLPDHKNQIVFRMFFNGYLTFGAWVGEIDVIWQGTEVFEYSRSTQSFKTSVIYEEPDTIRLPSVSDMEQFFEQSDQYELGRIRNITLGYTIDEYEDYVIFSPNWYFLYDGEWSALMDDDEK